MKRVVLLWFEEGVLDLVEGMIEPSFFAPERYSLQFTLAMATDAVWEDDVGGVGDGRDDEFSDIARPETAQGACVEVFNIGEGPIAPVDLGASAVRSPPYLPSRSPTCPTTSQPTENTSTATSSTRPATTSNLKNHHTPRSHPSPHPIPVRGVNCRC